MGALASEQRRSFAAADRRDAGGNWSDDDVETRAQSRPASGCVGAHRARGNDSGWAAAVDRLAAAVSVYSLDYLRPFEENKTIGVFGLYYNLLLFSLTLVFTASNAFFFLIAWEAMALAAYCLVSFEHRREETRKAGVLFFEMAEQVGRSQGLAQPWGRSRPVRARGSVHGRARVLLRVIAMPRSPLAGGRARLPSRCRHGEVLKNTDAHGAEMFPNLCGPVGRGQQPQPASASPVAPACRSASPRCPRRGNLAERVDLHWRRYPRLRHSTQGGPPWTTRCPWTSMQRPAKSGTC